MKKLLILILIAALGYPAYNHFAGSHRGAFNAYKEFADALLYQRWDEALKYVVADSQAEHFVYQKKAEVDAKARILTAQYEELYKPYINRVTRRVRRKQNALDGHSVNLEVTQFTRESMSMDASVGPPRFRYDQRVLMVLTDDGGWGVERFLETRKAVETDER